MKIKIVFYKSSSKFYDSVCLRCEEFENYSQEKSVNVLEISVSDIRGRYLDVKSILETVRHWTKTEYFIDENKATITDIDNAFSIIACENECNACVIADEHCYESAGWGCRFLSSIALRKNSYYSYHLEKCWYEFGYFENDIWRVDKARIKSLIQKEVQQKHIEICQCFSFERLEKALDTLPDIIEVTEESEWEYKYRDAPMGMKQTEIIGVKPKEIRSERFGLSFSTSIFGDEPEKPEEIAKHVPSTTFKSIGGLDGIVQQVREVIELPLIAPELFEHYHIKPHKGVLLYGPPGCGKTLIAKAIANEINAHFISVNGPEILNKYGSITFSVGCR